MSRELIASDCDCGTSRNDKHEWDCATHQYRCCSCCETHTIPHRGCILR